MPRKQTFTFEPVPFDFGTDLERGAEVQLTQPAGTPRNGTMGQVYVQLLDGTFVGMVCRTSLVKTGRTAPYRDQAAEARTAKDAERETAREARRQERAANMFTAIN